MIDLKSTGTSAPVGWWRIIPIVPPVYMIRTFFILINNGFVLKFFGLVSLQTLRVFSLRSLRENFHAKYAKVSQRKNAKGLVAYSKKFYLIEAKYFF